MAVISASEMPQRLPAVHTARRSVAPGPRPSRGLRDERSEQARAKRHRSIVRTLVTARTLHPSACGLQADFQTLSPLVVALPSPPTGSAVAVALDTDEEIAAAERMAGLAMRLDGVLRGKYISTEKFLSAIQDGFGFCDVIFGWDCGDNLYDKGQFTGWHTGFPDLMGKIDPSTFRLVPWETYTAFALVDFYKQDGDPLPFCPRQTLKRVVVRAEDMGYSPRMAAEYEWFLFEETPDSISSKGFRDLKPESPGMFCYSLHRASARADLIRDWMDSLHGFGIDVEGMHTETGPGAFEACVKYGDRKSTRLNSSHIQKSRMPSSA